MKKITKGVSIIMEELKKPYGFELIMDLHNCEISKFNRKSIEGYMIAVCDAIKMKRELLHFWDYEGVPAEERPIEPHLLGTSAVQFIQTSNIVVHTLDLLKAVYINIFSCKKYDKDFALKITKEWFGAKEHNTHFIERI